MAGTELSINLGITSTPSTANEELYNELLPLYRAVNTLAYNLDVYTGNVRNPAGLGIGTQIGTPVTVLVTLSETITRGALLHLYRSGTSLVARKAGGASISANLCSAVADTAGDAGSEIKAVLFGYLDGHITGMTPGETYYTSNATAGSATNGAPVGSRQPLGFALDTNTFFFNPSYMVI